MDKELRVRDSFEKRRYNLKWLQNMYDDAHAHEIKRDYTLPVKRVYLIQYFYTLQANSDQFITLRLQ